MSRSDLYEMTDRSRDLGPDLDSGHDVDPDLKSDPDVYVIQARTQMQVGTPAQS